MWKRIHLLIGSSEWSLDRMIDMQRDHEDKDLRRTRNQLVIGADYDTLVMRANTSLNLQGMMAERVTYECELLEFADPICAMAPDPQPAQRERL